MPLWLFISMCQCGGHMIQRCLVVSLSQIHVQRRHVGHLKKATAGVFASWKPASIVHQGWIYYSVLQKAMEQMLIMQIKLTRMSRL